MQKREESYFVTGGTGFIGDKLIRYLLDNGHRVYALVRPASRSKIDITNNKLHWIEGDLLDESALKTGMENCDYVFHLAALAKPWAPDESIFDKVNVEGTRAVLSAALQSGIRKVVFTSTAGLMATSNVHVVNEQTPRKLPFFTPYERTKEKAEQLVKAAASKGKIETVIVSPSRVYGPGNLSKSNAVTEMIDRYVHGNWRLTIGDGKSIGNYTFIDDVVKGHLQAMEKGSNGERYILGGHNLSFNAFFNVLSKVSGVNRKLIHIPLWLALAFARFEKWKAESFGAPPLITPDWVKKYHHNWALSSDKARAELGYEITPVENAFDKTIKWLEERN